MAHINPTPEQVQATLEFAVVHGLRAAAREVGVDYRTIARWRDAHPQLWSDLLAGNPDAHKRGFAERLEALAERYTDAEHAVLDRAESLIGTADAKELAAIARAIGSNRDGAISGVGRVRGDHEQVEHTINFPALEQAMQALLERADVEPPLLMENLEEHGP